MFFFTMAWYTATDWNGGNVNNVVRLFLLVTILLPPCKNDIWGVEAQSSQSSCVGFNGDCTDTSDCCTNLFCDTSEMIRNPNPRCRLGKGGQKRERLVDLFSDFLWNRPPQSPAPPAPPTASPSKDPTARPSSKPSLKPSLEPSLKPSLEPSLKVVSSCPTVLKDNATLVSGEYICSSDGRYRFGVDLDGDIAVWDEQENTKLWSAETSCTLTETCEPPQSQQRNQNNVVVLAERTIRMQPDGNLVLRTLPPENEVLWASGTLEIPHAALSISTQGIAQIQNVDTGIIMWNTGPCPYVLQANQKLVENQFICSENHQYQFGLDEEGDVSVWEKKDGASGNSHSHSDGEYTKIWSAFTNGQEGTDWKLVMQGDGNAVLYNSVESRWSTSTQGNPNSYLYVDNAGVAKLQSSSSSTTINTSFRTLWRTNHCGYFENTVSSSSSTVTPAVVPSQDIVDASTLTHKIMAGYQGWFGSSCDVEGYGRWNHWTGGAIPSVDTMRSDMWPDLSEFDADELCDTDFSYSNGQTAQLFSSSHPQTVERHTKWMHDYGIDGVFVQRFLVSVYRDRCVRDLVLNHIRQGSEKYGRVFANMYDISGAKDTTLYSDLKRDWIHLVDDVGITKSPQYLHHNGKPVLSIWGFGFKDRPGDPSKVADLIEWFTTKADPQYQVTLMGGIPRGWRTLTNDSQTNKKWNDVYRSFDILSPWTVGRYRDEASADTFRTNVLEPDLEEVEKIGKEYLPVVFPGFSAHNRDPSKTFNGIPRQGGQFLWRQFYNAISAQSSQLYVAMFDEVDEGTAIFKTAETANQSPSQGYFVNLDEDGISHVPSDWYLRLTGIATTMLKDPDQLLTETMPPLPTLVS